MKQPLTLRNEPADRNDTDPILIFFKRFFKRHSWFITLFAGLFFVNISTSSALKLTIWNPELTTKIGAGESLAAGKFSLQTVKGYNGAVVVVFSQSEEDKKIMPTLQGSYFGTLNNGQLALYPEKEKKAENTITLQKLLSPYKYIFSIQEKANPLLEDKPKPTSTAVGGVSQKALKDDDTINSASNVKNAQDITTKGVQQ